MMYRELVGNDYSLKRFLINTPEAVAQAVLTRLRQYLGEWFLDITDGTPWLTEVVGHQTFYDLAIKDRILGTTGVVSIIEYESQLTTTRELSIQVTIETLYGTTSLTI